VVLAAPQALEDRVDPPARVGGIGRGDGGRAARGPGHERVELEAAQQLEALDGGRAVAGALEHRGDPLAGADVDRVAGEQQALLAAVPEERGRTRCVPWRGDDLEVVVEQETFGEGLVDLQAVLGRGAVVGMDEEGAWTPSLPKPASCQWLR
jgi:hypothetical protein